MSAEALWLLVRLASDELAGEIPVGVHAIAAVLPEYGSVYDDGMDPGGFGYEAIGPGREIRDAAKR